MALVADVIQDDAEALRLRLVPTRKVWRVLGWLPWIAIGIGAVVAAGPPALVIVGVWAWVIASDLRWGLAGWEEVAVAGGRVALRKRVWRERVVADVPVADVRAVAHRVRSFWTVRNDQRRLELVMADGTTRPFGQRLQAPDEVIERVSARLGDGTSARDARTAGAV